MFFEFVAFETDLPTLEPKMGGQSGSWTPTKRRGPIAAEFQGPGPAALTLPSLFGSKLKNNLYNVRSFTLSVVSFYVYYNY